MAVNQDDFSTILEQSANRVPYWARSTNPIVRRHMGFNWRTVPPEIRPILIGFGTWLAIYMIGIFIPFIQGITMMFVLASWIIMPFAWFAHVHILLSVASRAADIMQEEQRNNTLELLMATPMTLSQIFMGKVAASIWKRMEDISLLANVVVWLTPPMLYSVFMPLFPLDEYPVTSQALFMVTLAVSVLRVFLEPVMIGALAILVGVVTNGRSAAITSTIVLGGFYFLLMFLIRQLPMVVNNPVAVIVMEIIVPVAVPIVLTGFMLWLATKIVSDD